MERGKRLTDEDWDRVCGIVYFSVGCVRPGVHIELWACIQSNQYYTRRTLSDGFLRLCRRTRTPPFAVWKSFSQPVQPPQILPVTSVITPKRERCPGSCIDVSTSRIQFIIVSHVWTIICSRPIHGACMSGDLSHCTPKAEHDFTARLRAICGLRTDTPYSKVSSLIRATHASLHYARC